MDISDLCRSNWCGGQLLAFSGIDGPTDHQDGLTARTSFDHLGIEFKLPGECSVRFAAPATVEHWMTGDCFRLASPSGPIRGAFLDTHHLLIEGACQVLSSEDAIAHCARDGRLLLGAAPQFDATRIGDDLDQAIRDRSAWLRNAPSPAGLSDTRRRALGKMLSVMKTQVHTAQGRIRHAWTTPDRWPHRHMWLWDSAFHAIGWRHVDPALAKSMLSAMVEAQHEDGFMPHMVTPHGDSEVTQPPVLAFGVKLVHEVSPDREWVESLYPGLCAYVEWDLANRDSDGAGLAEWAISGDPHCRSGESGMDNSPRFDDATKLDAVDFNAFLALECEVLAGFAEELGRDDDARRWASRHRRLCALIRERLWSETHNFFVDYDVEAQTPSSVLASSGFLPLICGAATPEQADQLAAHLRNPATFGVPCPVPSVAASCEQYAKDMWRGPTWINTNWLIAAGLARCGMTEPAAHLREQSRCMIEAAFERFGVAFEYYDDRDEVPPPQLLRKGSCAPLENPFSQVFHDYGWTATLYVDWVLGGNST